MGLFEPAEMAEFYLSSESEERYEEPDAPLCEFNLRLPTFDGTNNINSFYKYSNMFNSCEIKVNDKDKIINLYNNIGTENILDSIILQKNDITNDSYLKLCYNIKEFYDNNGYITDKQKMVLCKYCVYNNINIEL